MTSTYTRLYANCIRLQISYHKAQKYPFTWRTKNERFKMRTKPQFMRAFRISKVNQKEVTNAWHFGLQTKPYTVWVLLQASAHDGQVTGHQQQNTAILTFIFTDRSCRNSSTAMDDSTSMRHCIFICIFHCTVVVEGVNDAKVQKHLVQHLSNQPHTVW